MNPDHPTVLVDLGFDELIPVDEDIAELVRLLNVVGFDTSGSCQESTPTGFESMGLRWVNIVFVSFEDLPRFIRWAHEAGIDTDRWACGVWPEGGLLQGSAYFPFVHAPELASLLAGEAL